MKAIISFVLCCSSMAFGTGRALAQEDPHIAIRPYLDSQTMAAAWIDLAEADIARTASFLKAIHAPQLPDALLERLTAAQQTLVDHKVRRIYALVDRDGRLDQLDLLVIPTAEPAALAEALATLSDEAFSSPAIERGAVLVGSEKRIAAVRQQDGEPTKDLLAAIAAAEGSHACAMDVQAEQLMSALRLLSRGRERTAEELTRDARAVAAVQWLALAGGLPPEQARLQVGCKSASAAGDLETTLKQFLAERLNEPPIPLTWTRQGQTLTISADNGQAVQELLARFGKSAADRMESMKAMKQVALALHNYSEVHRSFPPQALVDSAGNRLLSWRVLILPFLDQQKLYEQFRLDESWDSPHNRKLAEQIPSIYSHSPKTADSPLPTTRIVAPLTDQSVFGRPGPPVFFTDIRDGSSVTIWLVETSPDKAVIWTKPEDLVIDPSNVIGSMGAPGGKGVHVSFVDGSVRFLSSDTKDEILQALLTIDGGETVDFSELK